MKNLKQLPDCCRVCSWNCMYTHDEEGFCCLYYSSINKDDLYNSNCEKFERGADAL